MTAPVLSVYGEPIDWLRVAAWDADMFFDGDLRATDAPNAGTGELWERITEASEKMHWGKPLVYLHSDTAVPECDCGEREWVVETPEGYMWRRGSFGWYSHFTTFDEAIAYANTLNPRHPDLEPLPFNPHKYSMMDTSWIHTPL